MDDLHSGKEGKRAGIFRIGFPIARRHLMKEGEEGATLVTKLEGGGGRRKKTEEERVFSVLHKMKKVWKDAFRPKVRIKGSVNLSASLTREENGGVSFCFLGDFSGENVLNLQS